MTTARSGSKRRACSSTCMPPTPFMLRSVMTTWKLPVSICRSASSQLAAVSRWYPSLASSPFSASSIAFSSSTTRMRPCISAPRRHRQRDLELGPAADLARHLDRALVRLDDLLRDRHAEPGAALLGGEERVEDAVELLGRDAAAVVAHPDGGEAVAVLDEQVDAPSLGNRRERVDGVVDDVGEHLAALRGGDRVPDLVRDAGGQLVDARLLLGLHRGALAAQLAIDRRLEVSLAQHVRAEHRHPVREDAHAPAERGPDEPRVAGCEEVD